MSSCTPAPDLPLVSAFGRALEAIQAQLPAAPGALAIAYSGGLDSSVLLRLAAAQAARQGLPLYAFHIHHGLSPHADAWEAHCRRQAAACGAHFQARRVLLEPAGRGTEEAARLERYAALGQLCREHELPLLLTAHHQDDQAETVLLQLLRGAGLPGLSGMAPCTPRHELLGAAVALGRPLLSFTRAQLQQAASAFGLQHVEDESNADLRYRRNALRQDVAPVLERHFPRFAARVARSAAHAQGAQGLLRELAELDLAACRAAQDADALDLERVGRLSPARADNLLRHWLQLHGLRLPSAARLEQVRRQMLATPADAHPALDFGTLTLHRSGHLLQLRPRRGSPPQASLELHWQGEARIAIPAWHGQLLIEDAGGPGLDPARLRAGPLTLRARGGGERLRLAPGRPSRSLKNLYQETGVPAWLRPWMPLLYLGEDLVFAAGLGMDAHHGAAPYGLRLCWQAEDS